MDFEFIKKEKNEIEFVVTKEDSSFFDLVINIASQKREVEFASLKREDNLEDKFYVYLKTKDTPAKDTLLTCINEAEENLKNIISNLEKTLPNSK